MKKYMSYLSIFVIAMIIGFGCSELQTPVENLDTGNTITENQSALKRGEHASKGNIIVANRASGSISVIVTKTDEVSGTYNLPSGPNNPEPMYVVYSK